MTDRLIKVMEYYDFSPSIFADEIGVLRSSISHILNGRNKPGLDLIQKVLTRFPEVSAEWLLMGKGSMLNGRDMPPQVLNEMEKPAEPAAENQKAELLPLEFYIEEEKKYQQGTNGGDKTPESFQAEALNAEPATEWKAGMKLEQKKLGVESEPAKMDGTKNSRVSRIILFYSDNTFQDFYPGA